ncbi:hypothetical protein CDV36_015961 [Fusarium kuroshium]|uniref:Uncharacterized protein n=1 Tax=Fusarium kuroshium TaxID=2010991 RepID=A0A3M2R3D1_9HYPO|nr:hypothetical protein CDV36_015961 [Fusarium kuroshium]
MVPNPSNNGPPPGFIEAQRRACKYKATQVTPDSTSLAAVFSQAKSHSTLDVDNLDPKNSANVQEITPQHYDDAQIAPHPTTSIAVPCYIEADAAANVGSLNIGYSSWLTESMLEARAVNRVGRKPDEDDAQFLHTTKEVGVLAQNLITKDGSIDM